MRLHAQHFQSPCYRGIRWGAERLYEVTQLFSWPCVICIILSCLCSGLPGMLSSTLGGWLQDFGLRPDFVIWTHINNGIIASLLGCLRPLKHKVLETELLPSPPHTYYKLFQSHYYPLPPLCPFINILPSLHAVAQSKKQRISHDLSFPICPSLITHSGKSCHL